MRAAHTFESSGSKLSKIAIVTALHAGVAIALIGMKVLPPSTPPQDPEFRFIPSPVTPTIPVASTPAPPSPTLPTIYVPTEVLIQLIPEPTVMATSVVPQPSLPSRSDGDSGAAVAGPISEPKADSVYKPAMAGDCTRPDYPARSARFGDTGTVTLALLIGPNGRVGDARIEKSSGHRELDRAAVAALSMCKFSPATANGVPEAAWGKIAYVWTLD